MAPEPAPAARLAPEPPATARALAPPRELLAVARTTTSPATASPARRSPQMSLDNLTCSYFGPVADRIKIGTGQFDRFRVISPKPAPPGLNHNIEIEDQAARVGTGTMPRSLKKETTRMRHAASRHCRPPLSCASRTLPLPTPGRCGPDREKCCCCHRPRPNSRC